MTKESGRAKARVLDTFLEEVMEGEPSLEPVAELAATTTRVTPTGSLRDRILGSTKTTHRFDDLEARVADVLDIDAVRAAELLRGVDGAPELWEPGPRDGVTLYHLTGGAKVADAVTGFVRVEVGAEFPEHTHVGDEVVLVLQGSFEDSDGRIYRPGDAALMAAGTTHRFRSLGPARLVGLAVVHGGVIIDGHTLGPNDPRA